MLLIKIPIKNAFCRSRKSRLFVIIICIGDFSYSRIFLKQHCPFLIIGFIKILPYKHFSIHAVRAHILIGIHRRDISPKSTFCSKDNYLHFVITLSINLHQPATVCMSFVHSPVMSILQSYLFSSSTMNITILREVIPISVIF